MRLLATLLLVCFAALATTDAFFCPDGCRQATTAAASDHCNDSGACFLCTGACGQPSLVVSVIPVGLIISSPDLPSVGVPAAALAAVYRPPRIV